MGPEIYFKQKFCLVSKLSQVLSMGYDKLDKRAEF